MSFYRILKDYSSVYEYLPRVQLEADNNKPSLGFLPPGAYESQARQNKLWIVVSNTNDYLGHLMFGGRYPVLKISQIYISPEHRGQGIAKKLFQEFVKYGEKREFTNIRARVAADLDANAFYMKKGFKIISQEKGGETTGRIINIQNYDLNVPSLFDLIKDEPALNIKNLQVDDNPVLITPTYTFDLNIIHDIIKDKELKEISGNIFALATSGQFQLYATPELITELKRTAKDSQDNLLIFAKNTLSVLPDLDDNSLNQVISVLDKKIFHGAANTGKNSPNKLSDIRHLAYSIKHGLTGFITRDNAILAASDFLHQKYKLSILSPYDFCFEAKVADNLHFSNSNNECFHFLNDTDISTEKVQSFLDKNGVLLNADNIWRSIQNGNNIRVAVLNKQEIVGLISLKGVTNKKYLAHIVVNEDAVDASRVIDHLIAKTVQSIASDNYFSIKIIVPASNQMTIDTLQRQGFFKILSQENSLSCFKKISCGYYLAATDWILTQKLFQDELDIKLPHRFLTGEEWKNTRKICIERKNQKSAISLFEFENIISPSLLMYSNREAVITPLEGKYSRNLFGNTSLQGELFGIISEREALLCIEKAYFRTPRGSTLFKKGMPIIFYESSPRSEAIGWARITSSAVKSVDEILIQYLRQGVLEKKELTSIANNNNEVHIITFIDFVEFPNKIPFKELDRIGCNNGANFVTAQKVNFEQLEKIASIAFGK